MNDESSGEFDPSAAPTPTRRARRQPDPGTYLFVIEHVEKTESGQGKPRVSFVLVVDNIPAYGENVGLKFVEDCYLTSSGRWKLIALAREVGVKEKFNVNNPRDLIEKFVGKRITATLVRDQYKNDEGAVVDGRKISNYGGLKRRGKGRAASPGGSGDPSMDPGQADAT